MVVSSFSGCATETRPLSEYEQKLQWVKQANAQQDAMAAVAKRDFRLMAMAQRGTIIPGVDADNSLRYELKCGIKLIKGVGDVIRGKEHLELMKKAHRYALKYNAIIKIHCEP